MLTRIRSRLTYANVMSTIAVFGVLGTGGAYAADTIGSSDIIDESILSQDIKDLEVKTSDLRNSAVTSLKINNGSVLSAEIGPNAVDGSKVLDDTVPGGGLAAADLAADSVGESEIAANAVGGAELQTGSVDSGKVVDFGLSNQDIGVLYAEVTPGGGFANGSQQVSTFRVGGAGSGQYEVDFGRDIATCTAVATIGSSGAGASNGEINVSDRAGNAEAVFVDTNDSSGAAVDRGFRLVIVC